MRKRFKNTFTVSKNGLLGRVIWWGHDTVAIEYINKGCFYACYEVYKTTLIANLKNGHYVVK